MRNILVSRLCVWCYKKEFKYIGKRRKETELAVLKVSSCYSMRMTSVL